MQIITRKAAREQGVRFYFSGKPCSRGHIKQRYVANKKCAQCNTEVMRQYRSQNPEKMLEYGRSRKDYQHEYYLNHRDIYLQRNKGREKYVRDWQRENYASYYESIKKWRQKNPHKVGEYHTKRRAAHAQAVPKWLTDSDLCEIKLIYDEAICRTKKTGIVHEVDHIVPLRGKNVCGLHVPWNLQILTKSENSQKRNFFEDAQSVQ